MKEEKQSYRRQSGCEAAYKMKKSGMREVLVWEKMKKSKQNEIRKDYHEYLFNRKYFVYAVRRIYGILYKITFAFDGLYF